MFLAGIITSFLEGTKRIGYISSIALGVMEGTFFLLPVPTDVHFYDTWLPWAIDQSMANAVLLFCLIKEYRLFGKKGLWTHAGIAFLDINMSGIGGLGLAEKLMVLHPRCKITYRFTGESLSIDEQIWTSEEPHDMADFALLLL